MSIKLEPDLNQAQNSPVMKAILNRRDARDFIDKQIPAAAIKKLLYAAIWAPNHKLTEPWKFTVITSGKVAEFIDVFCKGLESLIVEDSPPPCY